MSGHLTQNFHKQMDSFQIGQFVVIRVHAAAEEQTGVAAVDDLVVAELYESNQAYCHSGTYLDEVTLVLLVSRCNQTMYFSTKSDLRCHQHRAIVLWTTHLLIVIVRCIPL